MENYWKELEAIAEWFNNNIGECTHDGCVIWHDVYKNEKEYWRKIMRLKHIVYKLNEGNKNVS